ncbi:MAG: L-threonylcarbamoyladenylate synthase [Patescibacteria group bacterium]
MEEDTFESIVSDIKNGKVGVIPTDTMYGIIASVSVPVAVEKIYELRHRDTTKRCIVLISSLDDLSVFGTSLDEKTKNILNKLWPGPFSIDLPVDENKFPHLTRGRGPSVAFRLPDNKELINFIKQTGPIIAPSANTEGKPPAKNLEEAKKYFPNLDFYVDGGLMDGEPSTVVFIVGDKIKIFRQGKGIVPPELML